MISFYRNIRGQIISDHISRNCFQVPKKLFRSFPVCSHKKVGRIKVEIIFVQSTQTQRGREGEREGEGGREREWVKKLFGKFKTIPQTLDLLFSFYELKLH